VQTLKSWGLSKAAIEPWGEFGFGWSAEKTSLSMRTPYYSPLIAYCCSLERQHPGPGLGAAPSWWSKWIPAGLPTTSLK
jgi:hypothetical protein